jgi:flagellar biosynthesis GTPase FlhF
VLLGACTQMESRSPTPTASPPAMVAPAPATVAPYLETLANMAPGDPARQQAELAATLATARQTPTAANRLRYALALGAAGHKDSNPVEAKRLLADLLAGPNDLDTEELELANAYLREFDARVALYAELARQREESQQKLKLNDSSATKRADALAAENARMKKQLAEANRKLEAVAEMERSLQEQAQDQAQDQAPAAEPEATPPRP